MYRVGTPTWDEYFTMICLFLMYEWNPWLKSSKMVFLLQVHGRYTWVGCVMYNMFVSSKFFLHLFLVGGQRVSKEKKNTLYYDFACFGYMNSILSWKVKKIFCPRCRVGTPGWAVDFTSTTSPQLDYALLACKKRKENLWTSSSWGTPKRGSCSTPSSKPLIMTLGTCI